MRIFLAILLCFGLSAVGAHSAPSSAERRAFKVGETALHDGSYARADEVFGDFIRQFPASELATEAVLNQAKSRVQLKNYTGVVELLGPAVSHSGKFGDQYYYWLAEAYFQQSNFVAAAEQYAHLTTDYQGSNLALEASYNEALSRHRLGDLDRVIDLLRKPEGIFQKLSLTKTNDVFVSRGLLLLSESLFTKKDIRGVDDVLAKLAGRKLEPEQDWERQYLLTRVQQADGKLTDASQSALNLLPLAKVTKKRDLEARSIVLQGEILFEQHQLDDSVAVYQKILDDPGYPPEFVRQALLRIVELTISRNELNLASDKLQAFLQKYPNDPALDLVHLTLAELRLRYYFQPAASGFANITNSIVVTNYIKEAEAHLDQVITNFAKSPLLGKARLDRGWCYWEENAITNSLVDFKAAAESLEKGEDQAVAFFKWADTQYRLKMFSEAVTNYQRVINDFGDYPKVKSTLFDQALYQTVRCAIELNNANIANTALDKILAWYPDSYFSDRSMLLLGQILNHAGKPEESRALFQAFLDRFGDKSALVPEVRLAIGRTYVKEQKWQNAIAIYDQWANQYTNHPALARAEFDRGWLRYKAGNDAGALTIYTNLIVQFPTNILAMEAQFWVGTHYYNEQNFTQAEKQFQLLFQNTNWTANRFTYEAWMMAGRSAVARQSYNQAEDYFRWLITNGPPEVATSSIPATVVAQAYFALGDTIMEEAALEPTKSQDKFGEAIKLYTRITQSFTNHLTPLAFGAIANCNLQLATQEPARYDWAKTNYQAVINSPLADVATRSKAGVGLGVVLEKQARLKPILEQPAALELAINAYKDVVDGRFLRDGETIDVYWVRKAGLEAGRILEELQRWNEAINLYRRLETIMPPLKESFDKKIVSLQQQLEAKK